MYFCILKTPHSLSWSLISPLKDTECLSQTGLSVHFVLKFATVLSALKIRKWGLSCVQWLRIYSNAKDSGFNPQ